MRLLLDNNLSSRLVYVLTKNGWDVVHVGTLGLRAASHEAGPSVVLVRRVIGRRVDQLASLLLANLPQVDEDLQLGSIVVMGDDSLRVRRLPIG